ncbi:MAG: TAXI family TRAP transporter solute-binding subunit [Victivallales bacterium]
MKNRIPNSLNPETYLAGARARLNALFARGLVVYVSAILLVVVTIALAVFLFINSAVPNTMTITSGTDGSIFRMTAEKYRKILAREGITLKILPSEGSTDNLKKLVNPKIQVDVGFVQGGEANDFDIGSLVSLGSVSYQPLIIFYRGEPKKLLSDFKGERLDIGQKGSGAHSLALELLKANGIEPGGDTVLVNTVSGDLVQALAEDRVDAIFLMSDSASIELMRKLLYTPGIRLFNFTQADGYTRRITYLSKLDVPRGTFDFGRDIPSEDMHLIGPAVELIARNNLHPALVDLLLETAREVHSPAGIFKKSGEFPVPLEREFRISPEASRYYASGKSYLYRTFPFWLASLINRSIAAILPIAILLIPGLKIIPVIYRWRMRSRVYRWYRVLFELERDTLSPSTDAKKREELMRRLDRIEKTVNKIIVPAAYGDLLYALRGHIGFVRDRLLSEDSRPRHDAEPQSEANRKSEPPCSH